MKSILLVLVIVSSASFANACPLLKRASEATTFINQSLNNSEVRSALSCLGAAEIKRYSHSIYYIYPQHGVDFRVDPESGRITTFFFYVNQNGRQAYHGRLPFGIKGETTRNELWSVFGIPRNAGGGDTINKWETFVNELRRGSFDIHINYGTNLYDTHGENIGSIVLSPSKR